MLKAKNPTEMVCTYSEIYSKFSVQDILEANRAVCIKTNSKFNFGQILNKLIKTAYEVRQYEACEKLTQTKIRFDMLRTELVNAA